MQSLTDETLTLEHILGLRAEAATAGDIMTVALCDIALEDVTTYVLSDSERAELAEFTRDDARSRCLEIINVTRAASEQA